MIIKIIERLVVPSNKVHRKEKKEKSKKEKKHKNVKSIKQLYPPTEKVSDESEQLERSCLTEENVSQHNVGYLSDGSQNSKKRRREASPAPAADGQSNIKATPVVSKPLRIRFVFKKPKEAEVFVPQEDPVCSTSGTDRPSEVTSSVSAHDENLVSFSPENDKTAVLCESKKKKKHRISKESRYSSLFDEPVLPCILMEEDDNCCDDWLLGSRRQENAPLAKSLTNEEDMVSNMQKSGDSCFPRPQFLPEVEIFSLPYTVLF
ncbi:DNA ligase-like protein [Hirschfeldia incana]|nr:DNA ligase-like protein [Hirschfeldia incana]